jgi:hypothetical protein
VLVTVFADPDPDGGEQPDAVVAQQEIRLQVLPEDDGPVRNENRVFVRGEFEETMQIQVSPVFVDTGPASRRSTVPSRRRRCSGSRSVTRTTVSPTSALRRTSG